MVPQGHNFVILLCLIFCCRFDFISASVLANLDTLVFAHVVWRHGDRSPADTFPTDVNNTVDTWPQGWGELSKKGMTQQYQLGQFLRTRYGAFISQDYSKFEIYVRSTGYNRTLMSAQANMAGLFPPTPAEQWRANLSWQPVPVHSRPRQLDPMLWMDKHCPTEDRLFAAVRASEAVQRIEHRYATLIDFLRLKTGDDIVTLDDIWRVYDPLKCEREHADTHAWPTWVNETLFAQLERLYDLSFAYYYPTAAIQRLRGGMLLGDMLDRMEQRRDNQTEFLDERMRFYAYSAHDTTMAAILENFGVYNGRAPPYASCFMVELHRQANGSYTVELWYRNETEQAVPHSLQMAYCPQPCTLSTLVSKRRDRVPVDWHDECGLVAWYDLPAKTYLYLICGLLVLILLFMVASGVLLAFLLRRNDYKYREIVPSAVPEAD